MKKTLIFLASAAMALVACNKETLESDALQRSADGYNISAISPDTKALVDGLQVNWTTGDQVALFQTAGDPELFTLVGEGPVVNGTFHSDAASLYPNGIAAFPGVGASNDGTKVSVVIPAEIPYGTSPIPMIGHATSASTFEFALACGAIEISIKGVPAYPCNLVVISDQDLSGTLVIPDVSHFPHTGAFASEGAGKMLTVTGIPMGDAKVTLPVLPGTHSLQVALVAVADGVTIAPRSGNANSALEVEVGKVCKLKQIDLEIGAPVKFNKTAEGTFSMYSLPGTWNVYGTADTKKGLYVFGGGGYGNDYPAKAEVADKNWCWNANGNYSYKNEYDNELTINVTSLGSPITGTFNWTAGADGKFWDYKWGHSNASYPEYQAFNGTDLSAYYDKIPRGEHTVSLDIDTWDVTFDTGIKAHVLAAGTYTYCSTDQQTNFNRTVVVPDNCFALMFHIGNHKPQTKWNSKDIDRFLLCPLEYIIIFEKP